MKNETTHESFVVKPSTTEGSGVGVFILHEVTEGAHMKVFSDDFQEEIRDEEDIPEELKGYCLGREDGKLLCPKNFNKLDIGNYLNHSGEANLVYKKGEGYFALRNIKAGEELFANYNELGEPEEAKDGYYND